VAGEGRRETVYYRLHASGHRERWREAVTSPLAYESAKNKGDLKDDEK
jgi:hypothetical protein